MRTGKDTARNDQDKLEAITYLNMGVELAQQGDLEDAVVAFCRAIQLDPHYAQAYSNLGLMLMDTNRLQEAEACLYRAIELKPDYAAAYNNLGLVLMNANRLGEAESCFRQALELDPNCPEVYNNLGLVLEDTTRLKEAEALFRRAIEQKPNYAEAHYNLGNFLKAVKRLDEAEKCLLRASELRPDYQQAHFALASLYLLRGQYEQGWEKYDKLRLKKSKNRLPEFCRWQGEDLTDRKILLFHEQGFGDTIQFVRYVKKVAELAHETILWVQKPLTSLMAASYTDVKVHTGECPPTEQFDFACPLPSLPMIFNSSEKTIPRLVPYIHAVREISAAWRRTLVKADNGIKYRVGVVWAGNPKHHNDRNRSVPFAIFRELFAITEINWVSLQVGVRAEDLKGTPDSILDLSQDLVDFSQTAGVMDNLDLVITVDSAVAHLAGAMGKETWLLLPVSPDWRWQLEREDSPWYPTMRLFRQLKMGEWSEVLARAKVVLRERFFG